MSATYQKRYGFARNPGVAAEIATLDARQDCQRIAYLLTAYEFSGDFVRALEVALFYTYGSQSVAQLLNKTREFADHGQKRYDDTSLLMMHIIYSGWDGEFGQQAIARVNRSHGHYRIDQDDFRFVLWTFIEFPIRWTRDYGWRQMTAHEQQAWFNFWVELGQRLQITAIPDTKVAFDGWVAAYKRRTFVPNADSAQVAAATVRIVEHWLPSPLRGLVTPVVYALFDDDLAFLEAVQAQRPPAYLRPLLEKTLRVLARAKRHVVLADYPATPDSAPNRTYGKRGYQINELRPERLARAEQSRAHSMSQGK